MKNFIQFSLFSCFVCLSQVFCQSQTLQKTDSLSEKNIVIVLDNSGSMKKNDPERLTKTVFKNFINKIDSNTKVALVIFDTEITLSMPLTLMDNQDSKMKVEEKIESVNYNGLYTNIPLAIERAIYELKINSSPNSSKSIILLTDGYTDLGNKQKEEEKQNWLLNNLTQEAVKEKVKIFGIAFTENADYQLMQLLAQKTRGDYYRALTPKDIEPVFSKIYDKIIEKVSPDESVKAETQKQESKKLKYFFILSAVFLVFVAGFFLIRSKSKRNKVIISKSDFSDNIKVPPAKLIKAENKEEYLINKTPYSIGRKEENDLHLLFDTVSGIHAFIRFSKNKFFLEDNQSSNSTWINGKKIEPNKEILLKNKDVLQFDIYKYIFITPEQDEGEKTVLRKAKREGDSETVLRKKERNIEKNENKKEEQIRPQISRIAYNKKQSDEEESETTLKTNFCSNHSAIKASELCPVCKKAY